MGNGNNERRSLTRGGEMGIEGKREENEINQSKVFERDTGNKHTVL